jgi:hypothetical protein
MVNRHRHGFGVCALPFRMLRRADEAASGGMGGGTAPAAAAPAPATTAPAPATAAPVATPAPAATATSPAAAEATEEMIPVSALKGRLEREAKAALKRAGFENEEQAKQAAAAIKAQEEANKTAEQKVAEQMSLATSLKQRNDSIVGILTDAANDAMAALTAEQQAAVRTQVADDADPESRMKAIKLVRALTPKVAVAAPAATQPTSSGNATLQPANAPATQAAPANTAPPAAAPGAATASPPNHRSAYEQLRTSNPFEAAHYGLTHAGSVYVDK